MRWVIESLLYGADVFSQCRAMIYVKSLESIDASLQSLERKVHEYSILLDLIAVLGKDC